MIRPPYLAFEVENVSFLRTAALAVPAMEPAATAPAATTPAFTSASRRVTPPLTALSGVSLSDTARPSFRGRRSEDLTDPGSLTLDVVIKDGLAHLNVGEPVDGLAIDFDPEPRRVGDLDEAVAHLDGLA